MTMPALGFGTAAIMGRVSRRGGLAALERAHAAGIRHFDTARSYGWGETEGVLGSFLRKHARQDIRIVSKCGILPVRPSPILGVAKSVARAVLAVAPGLRAQVRRAASAPAFQPSRTYDLGALAGSLQTSLSELGVSYIDVFLLHNFEPGRPGLKDVVGWFSELKRAGTIRRYGYSVEGDLRAGLDFLAANDLLEDSVLQVPVSESLLTLPDQWRDVSFFAHSPFAYLRRRAVDARGPKTFSELLRALGDACRCEALVCSMLGPAHLDANVADWRASSLPSR